MHILKILLSSVNLSRWTMLGHVLRFPENSPAAASLTFAVEGSEMFKYRCRRHQTNLLNMIKCDLNNRNLKLDNIYDLYGVINHSGSLQFGHYYSYVYNEPAGKWFEYNDFNIEVANLTIHPYIFS